MGNAPAGPTARGAVPLRLTSGSTTWFTRVVPAVVAVLGGVVTAAAWLDLLGDVPAPLGVRWGVTAAWLVGTLVLRSWFGGFQHVALEGETLLIGNPRRPLRVGLGDVREVHESRLQSVKTVTLRLSRPTPLGDTIRFVPRGPEGWLVPWMGSSVVSELRSRLRSLQIASGDAETPP